MTGPKDNTAEVLICGAGIAGVSAAYHLAVRKGVKDILLVDYNPPLSLTSDQSTECYRNWWPGPGDAMVALMNRSIDILEELAEQSGNVFHLNRRGYAYCTADPKKISPMLTAAQEVSTLGAGPLRVYSGGSLDPAYVPAAPFGFTDGPGGADLLLDSTMIHKHFPYLSEDVVAVLQVRRAGWFSAQQLGMYLLDQARNHGVRLIRDRVIQVEVENERVSEVCLSSGQRVSTPNFVNAAGPFLIEVGNMLGVELPIYHELHLKVNFKDYLSILDRSAPLVIWNDPQVLDWSPEERQLLDEDEELQWLLEEMPPGVHTRPEGGPESQMILMLWEYHTGAVTPVWPIPEDPQYPEIALRGLARMIPGMRAYIDKAPRPRIDGGYYTKTRENRPLIGKLPISGAYLIGALSGFGLMVSCAAGELLAAHVTGEKLPSYAHAFELERYQDPTYQRWLENWGASGQL